MTWKAYFLVIMKKNLQLQVGTGRSGAGAKVGRAPDLGAMKGLALDPGDQSGQAPDPEVQSGKAPDPEALCQSKSQEMPVLQQKVAAIATDYWGRIMKIAGANIPWFIMDFLFQRVYLVFCL